MVGGGDGGVEQLLQLQLPREGANRLNREEGGSGGKGETIGERERRAGGGRLLAARWWWWLRLLSNKVEGSKSKTGGS